MNNFILSFISIFFLVTILLSLSHGGLDLLIRVYNFSLFINSKSLYSFIFKSIFGYISLNPLNISTDNDEGEIRINNDSIYKENDFVLFDNIDGNIILESIIEKYLVIILSGELINEPIVAHGPFVMNTEEEIIQAYDDFDFGMFGPFNF